MHTRESLEAVKLQHKHVGLQAIGQSFGVKSVSSDQLIVKILEAQNDTPEPLEKADEIELIGIEQLTARARNMEKDKSDNGAYFPSLVPDDRVEDIKKALTSFGRQFSIPKLEFFGKLQAFRLYQQGPKDLKPEHKDWIGLNEIIKMYELKIPLAIRSYSKRLYTAPPKRIYK